MQTHPSDDVLEDYSVGDLQGEDLEAFEEHLFICARCQDALTSVDTRVKAFQSAASALRSQPPVERHLWFGALFRVPRPVWALAAAALILSIAAGNRWLPLQHSAPPAVILLNATRGAGSLRNIAVPPRKPLILQLDLHGLPAFAAYRVEIVDSNGQPVFKLAAAAGHDQLRATVPHGLPGGMYYVRLYAPGPELQREFALQVGN